MGDSIGNKVLNLNIDHRPLDNTSSIKAEKKLSKLDSGLTNISTISTQVSSENSPTSPSTKQFNLSNLNDSINKSKTLTSLTELNDELKKNVEKALSDPEVQHKVNNIIELKKYELMGVLDNLTSDSKGFFGASKKYFGISSSKKQADKIYEALKNLGASSEPKEIFKSLDDLGKLSNTLAKYLVDSGKPTDGKKAAVFATRQFLDDVVSPIRENLGLINRNG